MIFNFTKNHQFTTRINVNNNNIEVVKDFKILGTIITDDLKWEKNISYLSKKAWQRMQLFKNAAKFTSETGDLKNIHTTFVRPVLEQSAPVWHSRLTAENTKDLERVQKAAVRLIMGRRHVNYKTCLSKLN